ncbi:MAG: type II secretion system F family protein [Rhodopirellula sp. JB044]|uniref:type II secretion system F family protein n=1 Tax=Rhodopirellula sp. JB044 TaxID=3342844 RepID=UPI00370C6E9F
MSNSEPSFLQVTLPHERALIRVLSMATRRRLPAARMVERLACEFKRRPARTLNQVARLLAEGTPIVDALEQTPRALDPTAVLLLRLASQTGTFSETLDSLIAEDEQTDAAKEVRTASIENQLYQVAVGFLMAWLLITFLLTFITPTFQKMFEEFGIDLPGSMLLLIAIGDYWPVFMLLSLVLLFTILIFGPLAIGRPRWAMEFRRRRLHARADLLSLLATIMQSGRPLASGIDTLSRIHPVRPIRTRLVKVSKSIDQGEDTWRALSAQKFIGNAQMNAFQTTQDPTAQAWLLRREARRTNTWIDLRSNFLARCISLSTLLLLAAVVLLASVAVFTSVYGLVSGLACVGFIG